MRKLFLILIVGIMVSALSVGTVSAGVLKDNTGCGLGTMLLKDAGDGLLLQLLATTTNGTFGNQTFGMTTGTLDCKPMPGLVSNELIKFAADNLDNLAKDIAMGQGETLDTLAEMMSVSDKDGFASKLQVNFSSIFTSTDVQATEVVYNIMKVTAES